MKIKYMIHFSVLFILICLVMGCDQLKDKLSQTFSNDLHIKLTADDLYGIKADIPVVMIKNNATFQIGKVTDIKLTGKGDPEIHIEIKSEFKKLVRKGTLFVINRPVFSKKTPNILIDTLEKDKDNPVVENGEIIHAITYADYQAIVAQKMIRDSVKYLKDNYRQFINELDTLSKSDEVNQLIEQLNKSLEELQTFSRQEKERFKKDILPKIENKIDEIIKQFHQQYNQDQYEKIRRTLEDFKNRFHKVLAT